MSSWGEEEDVVVFEINIFFGPGWPSFGELAANGKDKSKE